MSNHRHSVIALVAALLVVLPTFAQSKPSPTLTVRGTAVAADEKAATRAAIEKAVSGVLEIVLDAPARKKHSAAIAEKILPKAGEMVKSHEVLKVERIAAGRVSVQVRAVVDRAAVVARLTEAGVLAKEDRAGSELADKVVKFCKDNLGRQVDDGECGSLARKALEAAGAKPFSDFKENPGPQDFVWGELVFVLEVKGGRRSREPADAKPKPGDIIQYRDAAFRQMGGILLLPHHTAIVVEVKGSGDLVVLEQNMNGKKEVTRGLVRPNALASGWLRVYRPVVK